jgi:hypothetical protein
MIHFETQTRAAGVRGLSLEPKGSFCFQEGGFCPQVSILLALAHLIAGASRSSGQAFAHNFNSKSAELRIYARGSVHEVAVFKTDRIFIDHRKVGFFHVQLLPVLVVQGVRLELVGENPDDNWTEMFKESWLPDLKRGSVEWRDVTVSSQKEAAPRLRADRAHPAAGKAALICALENVTLTAGGAIWQIPRAELRNEDDRPRVVWGSGDGERHWDLFSGKVLPNSQNQPKATHEN